MATIFVTQKGIQLLRTRFEMCVEQLRSIQKQKGPAAEEGTWHDNFSFESLVRQESMLSKQTQEAKQLLDSAKLISGVPSGIQTLQIGHLARLYLVGDDVYKEVIVGGFGETDLSVKPPVIDYEAPLLKPFFGHEVGHEAMVQLGTNLVEIILETIKLRSD